MSAAAFEWMWQKDRSQWLKRMSLKWNIMDAFFIQMWYMVLLFWGLNNIQLIILSFNWWISLKSYIIYIIRHSFFYSINFCQWTIQTTFGKDRRQLWIFFFKMYNIFFIRFFFLFIFFIAKYYIHCYLGLIMKYKNETNKKKKQKKKM